ncbi:LysR family transcriptional regulator [Kibdelosporangium phytohabitans]|uniref:LysR family transcriptional regulator n=1 Tax=Kibdelosporangium phytohabitans TaxID=860235 RepID=A0A0N9IJZ1_9PSEU|nr:LysR substrate-binding domain-containing protein [Kibdelosporangium phytohabitans]ALG15380.1 LysR family transcriptional regulator [Kibdelosporangium phytohabitans]
MELRLLRYFMAVAEERHFGRAATRLHMTQPPLSRAIKQLETDLGVTLLTRSATGVDLTEPGKTLYKEAGTLLEQAEKARTRVTAAAGEVTLTVGTLGGAAGESGARLAETFRSHHPTVAIRFREADFTDPATGLRNGVVDVALTRLPFNDKGISTTTLRSERVGAVLRADDPLAQRDSLTLADLADRPWFQLPDGTDPVWRAYWNGTAPAGQRSEGPVARTVNECLQAVLWNGNVGISPLSHVLPSGLVCVPLSGMPPSPLVVAWLTAREDPLIRSFTRIALEAYR